jgi:hypothetical protein
MTAFRNRIVGLVRFSYPAQNGFSKSGKNSAALEAQLYDAARLERRFHLFEALTLPSLMAQTDRDFETIFLIGARFPAAARDRLAAAIAPLPGAQIVALPPMPHFAATQAGFAARTGGDETHLTGFRLDDDDALDRRFVARLRGTVATLLPITGPDRPLVVGYNNGIFLEIAKAGNHAYGVVEKLPLGIGLSMTVPKGSGENIFRRNHRLLPQFYHCFTDAETPAFIRTVHADNDSEPYSSGRKLDLTEDQMAECIAAHFPFTLDGLKRL